MGQSLTSPLGRLAWTDLIEPRYNEEYRTLKYQCGLVVPAEECEPIFAEIERVIAEKQRAKPSFNANRLPIDQSMVKVEGSDEKVPEEGMLILSFSTNAERESRGGGRQQVPPPVLYDINGLVIPPGTLTDVPSGSICRVIFDIFAYDKGGQNMGIAAGLRAVQIAKLEAGMAPPDAIEGIEGGFSIAQGSPGALGQAQPTQAAAPAAAAPAPAPAAAKPSALELLRRGR